MAGNPLERHHEQLREILKKSREKGVEKLVPAANRLLATVRNRIQQDGEKTDGGKIGNYSTTPMYASRDQFDKKSAFRPGNKAHIEESQRLIFNKKKGAFRGGKVTKKVVKSKMSTMYLADGYKELRDIQGKPTAFINLTYSGDLINSYQQQVKTNEIVQGLISERESLKRKGQEKRFGKIMAPQSREIDAYKKEVAQIVKDEIVKPFKFA